MGEWVVVACVDDIPEGFHSCVRVGETSVLIFNRSGEFHVIENNCTHLNVSMSDGELFDTEFVCPWHGAAFDIRTGKCLGLPGRGDVHRYPVRITENKIEIAIERIEES